MSGNQCEPIGQEPTDISLADFCKALGTTSGSETKFWEVLERSPGWQGLVSNRDNWETIAKALPPRVPSKPFVEMAKISRAGADFGILCVSMGCEFYPDYVIDSWFIQDLSTRQVEVWISKGLNDREKETVKKWVGIRWKEWGEGKGAKGAGVKFVL